MKPDNKNFYLNKDYDCVCFQLQQEEEEIIRKREANNTALAAIGPRKKRKLDEALEGYTSSPVCKLFSIHT